MMPAKFWIASLLLLVTLTLWELVDRIPQTAVRAKSDPAQTSYSLDSPERVLAIAASTGAWQYSLTPPVFNGRTLSQELIPFKSGPNLALRTEIGNVLADFYPSDKWVEVNTSTQTLSAHQGDQVIWTFPVSTGTLRTPTPNGTYQVWIKLRYHRMIGPGYDLPNVPFVQYFHRGYGLHGTYWHSNWGHPMSHGCVNLKNEDAEKVYYWTDPWVPADGWGLRANNNENSPLYNPGTRVVVVGNTRDAY